MGSEKFPGIQDIAWGKIKQVRVSSDGKNYSFEFDLHGRKQKMTMSIANGSTSFTLSGADGTPIVNATQKGREVRVLDFSTKLSLFGVQKKMKGMKPRKN